MRFVIYKSIIISVFCKGTFMSGAPCEMPFSHSFAECDLSEKSSPVPVGLRLLRHGTHCSSTGRSLADDGATQLMLDTKSNWSQVRRWQPCLRVSVYCSLLCAFFIVLPTGFPTGFCLLLLVWTTGLWGGAGAAIGVLQFDYTIYSHSFVWAPYAVPHKEPQFLLLRKVKQIRRVRLPCCSTVTNDCSICCCFPGYWELSASVTPPGAKSWLSIPWSPCT